MQIVNPDLKEYENMCPSINTVFYRLAKFIGVEIAKVAIERNLSNDDLAKELSLDVGRVDDILCGKYNLSLEDLAEISFNLGLRWNIKFERSNV